MADQETSVTHCARAKDLSCTAQFRDSGRWARTRAQEAGWFFPRGEDKAYCPDHHPPWLAAWQARIAAKRNADG